MNNELENIIAATDTDGGVGEEIEVSDIKLLEDGDVDGQNND